MECWAKRIEVADEYTLYDLPPQSHRQDPCAVITEVAFFHYRFGASFPSRYFWITQQIPIFHVTMTPSRLASSSQAHPVELTFLTRGTYFYRSAAARLMHDVVTTGLEVFTNVHNIPMEGKNWQCAPSTANVEASSISISCKRAEGLQRKAAWLVKVQRIKATPVSDLFLWRC